jgi:hypothetical protein
MRVALRVCIGRRTNLELFMTRALSSLTALLLVLFAASSAEAKTRVTVHEFFGPHGSALRAEAEQLLKRHDGVQVISKSEVDAAAHNLGVDLLSPAGRRTMSRELGLSAWVTGIVRKHGRHLRLTVVVYDGAEHENVGRAVLDGANAKTLQGVVKRKLWEKAKDAIFLALAPLPPGRAPIEAEDAPTPPSDLPVTPTPPVAVEAPPAQAEPQHDPTSSAPAPEASSSPSPAPSSANGRHDAAPSASQRTRPEALHAALSMGSPYRRLAYSDPFTSSLGDYQLAGMPMLDLNIVYYPARSFTDGVGSWFGLDLNGQFGLGPSTNNDRDGNRFSARYDAYRFGVRVRVPVHKHALYGFSGYAIQRIGFSSDTRGLAAPTPDIDYRLVRSGLGAELSLTNALLLAIDGAFLHVLSVGEIGAWFPRATAGGAFEIGMSARYALGHRLFARLTATYQRMAFDFHPKPGDAKVAGGAIDQLLTASLGIGVGI